MLLLPFEFGQLEEKGEQEARGKRQEVGAEVADEDDDDDDDVYDHLMLFLGGFLGRVSVCVCARAPLMELIRNPPCQPPSVAAGRQQAFLQICPNSSRAEGQQHWPAAKPVVERSALAGT